jgi:hypothetical protein
MRALGFATIVFATVLSLQLQLSAQTSTQTTTGSGGSVATAHALLEMLQKQTPKVPGISHELGLAYYRNDKLVEAEKAFADAMHEDPADEESVQLRGLTIPETALASQPSCWAMSVNFNEHRPRTRTRRSARSASSPTRRISGA